MNLAAPDPRSPVSYPRPLSSLPEDNSSLQDYIEQSRATLESQRASFESERSSFSDERKLWSQEREILKSRIASLEKYIARTHVNMSTAMPITQVGDPAPSNFRVWEGSKPTGRPTRSFVDGVYDQSLQSDDPQMSGRSPSLDEALSPRTQPVDRTHHIGIPVELVDSTLDGITLKSTGLPPDVAAKLTSPLSSNISSPPHRSKATDTTTEASKSQPHHQTHDGCDAGAPTVQTAPAGVERPQLNTQSTNNPSDQQPNFTPDVDSPDPNYTADVDEDPELTGPLMLQNDEEQDLDFLEALDKKLLMEAKRMVSNPALSDSDALSDTTNPQPEPEPEIRFKKSTNFGTAFGSTQPHEYIG
ncbi:uncharacterized protein GIQ15_05140 [Arthroderma uncinatum]|uniref:uncharacterized protein n=1 Tax=Arthroderma uncinatum TaxID=74035 RepID=UPI00144AAF2F|nr:uncharacterized protein GIQ15_05140 [Arthroderma uncinatum]KAF3482381.1 hypothetical protein GIQ15_05140 [Arthroderma uncinatum]